MFVPPVPPPLTDLGQQPFRFSPPILGSAHNEWIRGQAHWNDVQFVNRKTGQEAWIPRRFLGSVSFTDDGDAIVRLVKELELRNGLVTPLRPRIIEMPLSSPMPEPVASVHTGPARVVSIRLERDSESRAGRLLLASLAVGLAGCVALVSLYHGEVIAAHVPYSRRSASNFAFSRFDDESTIVHRLGEPSAKQWKTGRDGEAVRTLSYPARGIAVVLAGPDRDHLRYRATHNLSRGTLRSLSSASFPEARSN